MTVAVEIRLAMPSDLDTILDLIRACIARMRADGIDQWDDVYPTRETFCQDLLDETLWVATVDGVCQGVMVLNEHQDPEYEAVSWQYRDGAVLVVHRLAVNPNVQGQGIASQLMQVAETYARTHGYAAIRLDAFCANRRACELYMNRSYRIAGNVRFRKGEFVVFERCVRSV